MHTLLPPPPVELDPETAATVDEVCTALDWYDPSVPGSTEYVAAQGFGAKWLIAYRNTGDSVCRQRILAACEAIVRSDPDIFPTATEDGRPGVLIPRATIGLYQGRIVYLPEPATGEMRQVLQWPAGYYATGDPAYDRREAA